MNDQATEQVSYIGDATYSPDDNKIRIYPFRRLSPEDYARVKAAGFSWAPKQELFVAPMWTPERAELAEELCGEIADEDKSLVDRAEERAERFEGYSENRLADARQAKASVEAITEHIPLGQPILVGHHSERHARRDAEKIERGLGKAVKMWETANYWAERAKGAIAAAKYKERPAVRARRIKGIEADLRKAQRSLEEYAAGHVFWARPGLTLEEAIRYSGSAEAPRFYMPRKEGDRPDFTQSPDAYTALTHSYPNLYAPRTLEEVVSVALKVLPKRMDRLTKWIMHYENRLAYEKAMLAEQGASDLIAPKPRPKQLPLLNYRQEVFHIENRYHRGQIDLWYQVEMKKAEYVKIGNDYRGTRVVDGTHRVRSAMLFTHMHPGLRNQLVKLINADGSLPRCVHVVVFLTDSGVHEKPGAEAAAAAAKAKAEEAERRCAEKLEATRKRLEAAERQKAERAANPELAEFEALKAAKANGPVVKVVSANQLFPTPMPLARKLVELAGLMSGRRVLEPSAGTGNLVRAIAGNAMGFDCCKIVAVEQSPALVESLMEMRNRTVYANEETFRIVQNDFLECTPEELGLFDAVVMNPPFENGADIRHIQHALTFLKPGGVLAAICANGPRQQATLQAIAEHWEDLPEGSFAAQGTNVRTAMLVLKK